ncbi:hypothetical protein ASZ90_018664 [hydrocarbon metagenome]|uniref:Zinc-finger domain-containing protein n=1 Tax=hydrocarbon metagenome TaxID=938273 RepID=A0A0W8E5I8_9ZZZZ
MNCFKIRKLLSAFIDDRTDIRDTEMIIDHLRYCRCCEREFDDLKLCRNILMQMEQPDLPEGFALALHKRLIKEKWNT